MCDAIPFAVGEGTHSILSVLNGAHSIGEGILGFLTMRESNALRGACREFREAVMDFPWMDANSIIKSIVEAWCEVFPAVRAVTVSKRLDIVNADFVHIHGVARARLHTVNIWECSWVTDAAFVHLRGIQFLDMKRCKQVTITNADFMHLRGIHKLIMWGCNQATSTDAAFVHLRGIYTLYMVLCNQATITNAAFVHLRGINELYMAGFNQVTITDATFVHLRGIQELYISDCNKITITDASFVHLRGIKELNMSFCDEATITPAALSGSTRSIQPFVAATSVSLPLHL